MDTKSQATTDWLIQKFPNLQNIQPLSRGGQKQVFSAVHPYEGNVVLKLMHLDANIGHTMREILAVAQIQSPRVPKILDHGEVETPLGNCFWFREQYILGCTLREKLAHGPFDIPSLLRLALHVSETLVAAEKAHIVHRDVKPDNIILDQIGDFWLIDFGLARHLGLESLTATANFFGKQTWGYAPLEQCRNFKQEIDARADLFALGVTLYECATGINPFRAEARDELEIFRRVEKGNFPRLELSFPSANDFSDLVASLTQRQRTHRPENASEAYEWIKQICDKEGVQ
ncbi:MAG: serine/threonine-protein kinase [Syntrophobacteraceae bacterium]